MPVGKRSHTTVTKIVIIASMMFGCVCTNQSFAGDNTQTVIADIQQFIQTAQGKQQTKRSHFGDRLLASIQSILTKNTPGSISADTLFATTNTMIQAKKQTDTMQIHGYIFFEDITDHQYEQDIATIASYNIFSAQKKFYPHNYVRLADFMKVALNSHRISIGSTRGNESPMQTVQIAYDQGLLVGVIQQVTAQTIEKVLTYKDIQTILDNIHKQYPKTTQAIQVSHPDNEIVTKATMAHYVVQVFQLQIDKDVYEAKFYAPIANSPYYQQLQILIQAGVIPYTTNFSSTASLTRSQFIQQVVKGYALNNKVLLRDMDHDLVDVNRDDDGSSLLIYAYEQGRLDYILIQTKGQKFLAPNDVIVFDEVLEILAAISNKDMINGIIDHNTPITQEQIAGLLVDAFAIQQTDTTVYDIQSDTANTRVVRRIFSSLLAKIE